MKRRMIKTKWKRITQIEKLRTEEWQKGLPKTFFIRGKITFSFRVESRNVLEYYCALYLL